MTSPILSIGIVSPAPRGSQNGNGVTSRRWERLLIELGHRVTVQTGYAGEDYDVLISLHAMKSAAAIEAFHRRFPNRPQVLALTGTDLYGDLDGDPRALRSLQLAERYVVLQPLGLQRIPESLRTRAVVIGQSAPLAGRVRQGGSDHFDLCVLAHLRPVKDPLRAAAAVRDLPASSRIRVRHAGAGLDSELVTRAERESESNPRYRWLGELDRDEALALMAGSRLLVVTSRTEGGANVVTEAIAAGVPLVATFIDGSIGILGEDYPGYFPVGDTRALAGLLSRIENDRGLYRDLTQWVRRLAPIVDPDRERDAWKELLAELVPH